MNGKSLKDHLNPQFISAATVLLRRRLSIANAHHAKGETTRKSKKENEAYLQAANRWEIIKGTVTIS